MQRLLVSVRCPIETVEATKGGANIADLHKLKKEAWLAGSVTKWQLPALWKIGVDVICVRGAACEKLEGEGRFGKVKREIVKNLISTTI
ncbi:MAG: hypothetical protein O6940_01855 [Ignavibacteria bacterium]|nr:hypothetical protein [Ignavibacteria bacterium]